MQLEFQTHFPFFLKFLLAVLEQRRINVSIWTAVLALAPSLDTRDSSLMSAVPMREMF